MTGSYGDGVRCRVSVTDYLGPTFSLSLKQHTKKKVKGSPQSNLFPRSTIPQKRVNERGWEGTKGRGTQDSRERDQLVNVLLRVESGKILQVGLFYERQISCGILTNVRKSIVKGKVLPCAPLVLTFVSQDFRNLVKTLAY